MLLIIDNYDSFTYNLVQYFGELQIPLKVIRNDQIDVAGLIDLKPDFLVISPGPGRPENSGISLAAIHYFSGKIPVLGVCLGHQCIGAIFGAKVVRAPYPMHGKLSSIVHNRKDLFAGISEPFEAVRYHSLVVAAETIPEQLEVTATTTDGLVMGIRHRTQPTFGLQFHPESIFTGIGKGLLANFLKCQN